MLNRKEASDVLLELAQESAQVSKDYSQVTLKRPSSILPNTFS